MYVITSVTTECLLLLKTFKAIFLEAQTKFFPVLNLSIMGLILKLSRITKLRTAVLVSLCYRTRVHIKVIEAGTSTA